jgi:hypothetical protein
MAWALSWHCPAIKSAPGILHDIFVAGRAQHAPENQAIVVLIEMEKHG